MKKENTSAAERRAWIAQRAMENGEVLLTDIVNTFHITETSVRRDLNALEKDGVLKRVRKGAVPFLLEERHQSYAEKMKLNFQEKQKIGKAAASLIRPGSTMILDSGTTTIQIVKHIPLAIKQSGSVTIMTNSVSISQEFLNFSSPNLILLGGIFIPDHQATVGPQTIEQLKELTADYAFIGADGISIENGATTANILIAEVDRVMTERARKKVLVLDSSKFTHVGLVPVKPITAFDVIITDTGAPDDVLEEIRKLGVEVIVV